MENDKLFELMSKMYGEMQQGFARVDEQFSRVDEQFNGIRTDIKELQEGQIRIEDKLNIIYDQTARLTEFQTSTTERLDNLQLSVNNLEIKTLYTDNKIIDLSRKVR